MPTNSLTSMPEVLGGAEEQEEQQGEQQGGQEGAEIAEGADQEAEEGLQLQRRRAEVGAPLAAVGLTLRQQGRRQRRACSAREALGSAAAARWLRSAWWLWPTDSLSHARGTQRGRGSCRWGEGPEKGGGGGTTRGERMYHMRRHLAVYTFTPPRIHYSG